MGKLAQLVREGLGTIDGVIRTGRLGRPPRLVDLIVLGRALRPHFFALPAGAALAGGAAMGSAGSWRVGIAAGMAGIGWGVGQLVNDLMDREADTIDAPDRPAVCGALPEGPTMLAAMLLGLGIAVGTTLLHPAACWLATGAALLLLSYGSAKRLPLAGNLAHGALLAVATLIGAAAGVPSLPLRDVVRAAAPSAGLVGAWAMVYLESNYEKDRRGDRVAGYFTLPQFLGLRLSAALRVVGATAIAWAAHRQGLLGGWIPALIMAVAVLLVLRSSFLVLHKGTESAALTGYSASVHAAALGMFALGAPLLGDLGTLCLAGLNGIVVESAFRRSPNP